MLIVYIAGPMTGIKDFNYPAFHAAATHLRRQGYKVISPAEDDQGMPMDPPSPDNAAPHAHYVREGLRKMLDADCVALLTGWETSRGTALELDVAHALGMRIEPLERW